MKTAKVVGLICIASLVAAWPASAKDKPGKGGQGNKSEVQSDEGNKGGTAGKEQRGEVKFGFSDGERRVIQGYVSSYGEQGKEGRGQKARRLPPGLAKKVARGGKLPPGWEKKCTRGETMPAEVYQECHPLPPDLVVKLPPPPEPTITVAIGGKVVRLLKATREILDVFDVDIRL